MTRRLGKEASGSHQVTAGGQKQEENKRMIEAFVRNGFLATVTRLAREIVLPPDSFQGQGGEAS